MDTRDPTRAVAEAKAEIEETIARLRRHLARAVDPWETRRLAKLLDALMELQFSALPCALRAWHANPSDESVWHCLDDWEDAKAIMSPSLDPLLRRQRSRARRG